MRKVKMAKKGDNWFNEYTHMTRKRIKHFFFKLGIQKQ